MKERELEHEESGVRHDKHVKRLILLAVVVIVIAAVTVAIVI